MKYAFLLYLNRSGSTFLANELSKKREILVCPEAEILVNLLVKKPGQIKDLKTSQRLARAVKEDRKLKYWNLDPYSQKTDLRQGLDIFFDILRQYHSKIKPEADIILFKAVDLMHYICELSVYGERNQLDLLFISLIRDPRGIFNSQLNTFVESKRGVMNKNPLFTIYQWEHLISENNKKKSVGKYLRIRYEDLVNDHVNSLRHIYTFMKLDDPDSMPFQHGDLQSRIPGDQMGMHPHISNPPMPENAKKYRIELNNSFQDFFQRYAGTSIEKYGYELFPYSTSKLWYALLWIFYKSDLVLKAIYRTFYRLMKFRY